jgi:hypothetical protein
MNIDREFSTVENESNNKFRNRHRTFDEDYYKTRFEK